MTAAVYFVDAFVRRLTELRATSGSVCGDECTSAGPQPRSRARTRHRSGGDGGWTLGGRGDKIAADQAAVDAMRAMLDSVSMDGVVVIGEGEKDEAPMLFNGEPIGDGNRPAGHVAVDPLEGTRLTALGQPNAIAVIAVAERGTMFFPGAPSTWRRSRSGQAEST